MVDKELGLNTNSQVSTAVARLEQKLFAGIAREKNTKYLECKT